MRAYRWNSRFILTDRRVILKNGILRQRSTEFLLRNVESVLVEFPILGRLFNYGTLTIRGFGGSRDSIKRVAKPEYVRELIEEQQPRMLIGMSKNRALSRNAAAYRCRSRQPGKEKGNGRWERHHDGRHGFT